MFAIANVVDFPSSLPTLDIGATLMGTETNKLIGTAGMGTIGDLGGRWVTLNRWVSSNGNRPHATRTNDPRLQQRSRLTAPITRSGDRINHVCPRLPMT